MNVRFLALASLALPLAVASCGSHDDASHASHAAPTNADGGTGSVNGAATVEDPTLAPPTLDRLMRMQGGLHVMWTNPSARCAFVVGERMSATEAWREVFRVEGTYDNLHQDGMQAGVLYSYRLRCEQPGRFSKPSNEKSATP
jgi:hypothetical protein